MSWHTSCLSYDPSGMISFAGIGQSVMSPDGPISHIGRWSVSLDSPTTLSHGQYDIKHPQAQCWAKVADVGPALTQRMMPSVLSRI